MPLTGHAYSIQREIVLDATDGHSPGNGDGFIDMHELKMWEGGYFFLEDAIDKVHPRAHRNARRMAGRDPISSHFHKRRGIPEMPGMIIFAGRPKLPVKSAG